ncbi:hypothetical protein Pmani_000713 [Petrolisthes manimaculis]|uniref:Uncharacterized protein n=1 Tax=Petrolisthes manimaculis TaxID=1843537 RepID=A0AAE1QM85_9EUCA|nr:hypothetical protein Pmani_000713 [Petrolisthes manimaculis]
MRWVGLGHTIRMPKDRLPRKVLYGELSLGRRHAGGPHKRFKDHLKTTLKKCAIVPTNLETTAENRQEWHSLCRTGTEQRTTHCNTLAEERRQRRYAPQQMDAYASQGLDSSVTSESIECNRTEPDSSVFFNMVQSSSSAMDNFKQAVCTWQKQQHQDDNTRKSVTTLTP